MVEINNQRKAFLDMLAWSEGTDNGRQKTRNHGYDATGESEELFTDYPDHPRKLVTLNPNSNHCTLDATSFFLLVGCHCKQLLPFESTFLRKTGRRGTGQTKVICRPPKTTRRYPSGTDRCSNIWASLPGAVMVVVSMVCRQLVIAKSVKRRNAIRRMMYEQESPRLSLNICTIVRLLQRRLAEFAIAITPLPTKPSATKMPEN